MNLNLPPQTKKASFHFSFKVDLFTHKRATELRLYFRDIVKEHGLLEDEKYVSEPKIIYKILKGGEK